MLTVNQLSLSRSGKPLLDQVSFSIKPGQLTIVLGPNGAGKSTLLKCCSGALQADTGHINLDDKPLADWSLADLAKKRAVLTQQIHMPFTLTVKEVVSLGTAPWTLSNQQANRLIHDTLSEVGMVDTDTRIYASLSGGEQQRIQLARVLVQIYADPNQHPQAAKYLLLDEAHFCPRPTPTTTDIATFKNTQPKRPRHTLHTARHQPSRTLRRQACPTRTRQNHLQQRTQPTRPRKANRNHLPSRPNPPVTPRHPTTAMAI
ncbi:ATP-binding cassette domain-containing protein [Marinomonas rhodophyticola]|uniref:ATP-binding cassette domain-containing protein n=1 Tax=Marinomonas rhodophyticola TaxID=2992803 RepID=A0ABT3KKK5_9GAMM|nr:ATP-binding cassette domain-containing protein [Marinomonas sp. KJ51-3]MCW4631055.1 ATP-binding cassette domain-containing protein [Marinomonas sp. KJ51-3]